VKLPRESNLRNVRDAFQIEAVADSPIRPEKFVQQGFVVERCDEYDIDYVIRDMDSFVFWLQALDVAHSDFGGLDSKKGAAVGLVDILTCSRFPYLLSC
jgi:hypothetical protein